jgi:predicted alpha/beta superfamily hydrolase
MTEELQPLICSRYRVDGGDQVLFGHSSAGNFVGHALFRKPEAFSTYVAACPGFSHNDWDVFRLEAEYAREHTDLPVTVYLAAGSDEVTQFSLSGIVSGTARLAELLKEREYPGLQLTCEILWAKSHLTACTEIIERTLELCWARAPYELTHEYASRRRSDITWT